jgi:hypothetical protein
MSSVFSGLQKHDGKFLLTEDQIVSVARSAQSDLREYIPAMRYGMSSRIKVALQTSQKLRCVSVADHTEEFGLRPHEKDTSWKPWHYEV